MINNYFNNYIAQGTASSVAYPKEVIINQDIAYVENNINQAPSTASLSNIQCIAMDKFILLPSFNIDDESKRIIEEQLRKYANTWVSLSNV